MSVFNITKNMTNFAELLPLADGFTQGFLGIIILIVVVFGTAMIFRGSKEGWLAASVFGFIIAPILKYLNLIADWVLFTSVIAFIVAFFAVAFTSRGGIGA